MAAEFEDLDRAQALAAYGTPVIDGEIDSVWDKTSYNVMDIVRGGNGNFYTGWFKVLWDEDNLYVLAKVYGTHFDNSDVSPWNNDSFEIFVDEGLERSTKYDSNDYQVRSDFKGTVSGQNYDLTKVQAAGKLEEDYYYAEMKVPFVEIKGKADAVLGFDVQVNISKTIAAARECIGWTESSRKGAPSSDTSIFGNLVLKNTVSNTSFSEPDYTKAALDGGYNEVDTPVVYETVNNVTTKYDSTPYNFPILLADEYPMMSINNLATVIGGRVENGNTLIKDDVSITYFAGTRLSQYNGGTLMIEREPVMQGAELYVPVSSLEPTMLYLVEYFRFDNPPVLSIHTGKDYPAIEKVLYAKDFGAVGDGVHDDTDAVLKAINAAVMTGVPTRLEFEENAVYRMREITDQGCMIDIRDAKNIEIEGNNCTLLSERPINNALLVYNCQNVKISGITFDWMENFSTQGRIERVDADEMMMYVRLDEGFPEIPPSDWIMANYGTPYLGWFGQLYHPTLDRLKITEFDTVFLNSGPPIEYLGDRLYKIPITSSRKNLLYCYEVGDRLVIATRSANYDGQLTGGHMDTASSGMNICWSADVTIEDVTTYGSTHMGVSVGMCTGRVTFRRYKMLTKDGDLLSNNSDGIHYWRCRGGLILEDSYMSANLDDHINTKGEDGEVVKKINDRTFVVDWYMNEKVGDEFLFYNTVTKQIVGKAFLKSSSSSNGLVTLEMDREIDNVLVKGDPGVSQATRVYNISASARGSVVRNNTFVNSRRHVWINRSPNSIFENNTVKDVGGAAVAAMNEVTANACEGFTPSSMTIRNNYIEGLDGNTTGYYPIEIFSFQSNLQSQSIIDGVVLENNVINVPNKNHAILIKDTKNVYMFNNKIIYAKPMQQNTMPVAIVNSEIKEIDGLTFEGDKNEKTFITIAGCKVDEENIKNLSMPEGMRKYTIE